MANKLKGEFDLKLNNKIYVIKPTMDLLAEIEDEFGGLLSLLDHIQSGEWKLSRMTKLVYMLISTADNAPDYEAFSAEVFQKGAIHYLLPLAEFIAALVDSETMQLPMEAVKTGDTPQGEEQARSSIA